MAKNNSETRVASLTEYIEAVTEATKNSGVYIFRGQEDKKWEIESAATRRLDPSRKGKISALAFLHYHKDVLLEPAKARGYHHHEKRNNLSDMELLARLQHSGAATGLIDFTRNPLGAL